MIYLILYAIRLPGGKKLGSFYYGWANSYTEADKIFTGIVLSDECCRKEIWTDNGKGYRKLIKMEEYKHEQLPC